MLSQIRPQAPLLVVTELIDFFLSSDLEFVLYSAFQDNKAMEGVIENRVRQRMCGSGIGFRIDQKDWT